MLHSDLLNDFNALQPGTSLREGSTRRLALKLGLGLGFAPAAGQVVAQTVVKTPEAGLRAGMTQYDVGGYAVPAYYAAPADKRNLPVVLVVHEIFGVHEHIADVCRRFAQAGYLAIAPQLYARQGDVSGYTDMGKLMADVVSKVPDAQVMADLDGALKWAATQGGDVQRAAITGFCWGGRITWLYASHAPIRAAVAWYGRLVGASGALTPKNPIDIVADLRAPVLGLYGEKDGGIPLDTIDKMKVALAAGPAHAKASEFVIYPDAPHAFHADYRPSYRADAAKDGWTRCLAWLRSHGVA